MQAINYKKYEHMLRQRLAESSSDSLVYYNCLDEEDRERFIRWIVNADRESTRRGRIDKAVLRLQCNCDQRLPDIRLSDPAYPRETRIWYKESWPAGCSDAARTTQEELNGDQPNQVALAT